MTAAVIGPADPVIRCIVRAPLLVCAFALAAFGAAWAYWEACRAHPWLVPLGASIACVFLQCFLSLRCSGLRILRPSLEKELKRTVFELLCEAVNVTAVFGCNLTRLFVLASMELDEKDTTLILDEFTQDQRKVLFQQPVVSLLPGWCSALLLGSPATPVEAIWTHSKGVEVCCDDVKGLSQQISTGCDRQLLKETPGRRSLTFDAILTPRPRANSTDALDDLMQAIRGVEGRLRKLKATKATRILNEKVADAAVTALRQGGQHEFDELLASLGELKGAVEGVLMTALFLPLRIARAAFLAPFRIASYMVACVMPMIWAVVGLIIGGSSELQKLPEKHDDKDSIVNKGNSTPGAALPKLPLRHLGKKLQDAYT